MTSPWQREDEHERKALDHRAGPYQIEDTAAFMIPVLEQIQEAENMLWSVFESRFIDVATGHALGILAAIVGEYAANDGDLGLRLRTKLKLAAIRSLGSNVEVVAFLQLLIGIGFRVSSAPGWAIVTKISGELTSAKALYNLLDVATADGVRVRLETTPEAETFYWASSNDAGSGAAWPSSTLVVDSLPWNGNVQ